jgi:hypothetical protein
MWIDIVIELVSAALDALSSGGWKARRQRRKEIKAKRQEQGSESGLIQNNDA